LLILVLLGPVALAQTIKGVVFDGESQKPLFPVNVINVSTQRSVMTDEHGDFVIRAGTGEILSFTFPGYHTIEKIINSNAPLHIELLPINVKLPEYVLKDLTPYQKDSIEMLALYGHELAQKPFKPSISFNGGVSFNGLISSVAQRFTKSYKNSKRFKENFKREQEQKYIDSRYTPALVTSLTLLKNDSLAQFMNTYKIDYSFARQATDLEIKSWIRNNYKEYRYIHSDPESGKSKPNNANRKKQYSF
jgi:CarboxypepD_reg-like domain